MTTIETNGSHENPFKELSDVEMQKLMVELRNELKNSKKLTSRAIDAALVATSVAIGAGAALTVYHFATRVTPVG